MVKIGINGFGRIGRTVLHKCLKNNLEVVIVNDPFMCPSQMSYLFRFDSTHGQWKGNVQNLVSYMIIDGCKISITNEKCPDKILWAQFEVDYVVETTGVFTTIKKASLHLAGGARKVIITAPSNAPMFIIGVNHEDYNTDMNIISVASCTANCLVPLVKVIHDNFKIIEGLMTSVHAITTNQRTVNTISAKNRFRDGRSAFQNIIPVVTDATRCISHFFPDLKYKLSGTAGRIPVANVSLIDLNIRLDDGISYDNIIKKIKEAACEDMKGIVSVAKNAAVTSDFIGDSHSCIVDVEAGLPFTDNFVKLVAWYDNECGFASRICDMISFMISKEED